MSQQKKGNSYDDLDWVELADIGQSWMAKTCLCLWMVKAYLWNSQSTLGWIVSTKTNRTRVLIEFSKWVSSVNEISELASLVCKWEFSDRVRESVGERDWSMHLLTIDRQTIVGGT